MTTLFFTLGAELALSARGHKSILHVSLAESALEVEIHYSSILNIIILSILLSLLLCVTSPTLVGGATVRKLALATINLYYDERGPACLAIRRSADQGQLCLRMLLLLLLLSM